MQAWFNFYAVIGAAAATMTGLLFAATAKAWGLLDRIATLKQGDGRRPTMPERPLGHVSPFEHHD